MLQTNQQLTKKAKRQLRKEGVLKKEPVAIQSSMKLKPITPLTDNQGKAFDSWHNDKDVFMHGSAGTGKTLMALYFGLREVMLENADKVIIVRSTVPSRDMGFLPGSQQEKERIFELPYHEICATLYGRSDAYEILKQKGIIQFVTTSYIRGLTFDNTIVIVDECQNMAWHELNTIMGRIGNYSRFVFAGDTKQSDLDERHGKFDLMKLIEVCKRMKCFDFIQMLPQDVVRSGKAREYITVCENLGY
jgi:predicted ribonuclease YlaK